MNLLPFGELPKYQPRTFVPEELNWEDWPSIESLYDELERRISTCATLEDLEKWILDWSEFDSAFDEEASIRYIAMTCHTEDESAEAAYLRFVEDIHPKSRPRAFKLSRLYLDNPVRSLLPVERYFVYNRDQQLCVDLFREENIPLQVEEAKLEQNYQKVAGSLTVHFKGSEQTLVQMAKYLEEPDRALRQEAWELSNRRRLDEKETFEDIFDKLIELRGQIAVNAGFDNYRDYAFKARGRFDYTPDDCLGFHDAIASEFMPLVREIQGRRKAQMKLDALRPWDTSVDPLGRPPLKPFSQIGEMVEKTGRIIARIDGELADGFRTMRELKLLDLENRKGKAPGGYQSTLSESRLPFIFMNAVGVQRDVETLLHESGHAFHSLAARPEPIFDYRHAPIEFCEVASMSMELLGNEYIEEFYSAEDARRARLAHLEGIATFFPWMAVVDAFQHWIYTHPGHTREERKSEFERLMIRFGGEVDWSGYEDIRSHFWHRQTHIFTSPFYYVEYGIAQIGALEVWMNSRKDSVSALSSYKSALALAGSRPLPELFHKAGCSFRFDTQAVRPVANLLREEIASLS